MADPEDTSFPLDLGFSRIVDVPRALVWRAWTEPALITRWFTPAPWTTVHAEVDLVPGGRFRTVMRSPEGDEHDNTSCFLVVEPPGRLVWTSALLPGLRPAPPPPAEGFAMTAILEFTSVPEGTLYQARVLHATEADRRKHEAMGFQAGWNAALDQLVALVKSLPPERR